MRLPSLLFAALVVAAGTPACSSSDTPAPRTAAPPPAARIPPTVAEALEVLRTAGSFEDTHVGYSGGLSRYVEAFRVVLADANARASFHALVDRAAPAGRLYGAAGLYFADPPAFDAALARLTADGGNVSTQRGCDQSIEPVAAVIRANENRRIAIPAGMTLPAWLTANPSGGHCDIAGGCMPLMFVEDGRPAPREPAL